MKMQIFWQKICLVKDWLYEACFPPRCLMCGLEGDFLCEKHSFFNSTSPLDKKLKFLDDVFVAVSYSDDKVIKLINYFKFKGFKVLSIIIINDIFKKLPNNYEGDLLLPIPLHWTRLVWRGFNQSELLSKDIAKRKMIKLDKNLKRKKRTSQQSKLEAKARYQNIKNVFQWTGQNLKGKTVILVDDVITTGATLEEAARVLKQNGAKEVKAIVWAKSGI